MDSLLKPEFKLPLKILKCLTSQQKDFSSLLLRFYTNSSVDAFDISKKSIFKYLTFYNTCE